ncbi:protein MET1, chloroplastic [Trifolium repens]|nr:protein MET1, chloroplastic [Trifolium repens]
MSLSMSTTTSDEMQLLLWMLLNYSLLEASIDVPPAAEYGKTMYTICQNIGRRNAKYEEALEKFESVLGTKPELDEAAVTSYNVACCYSKLNQFFMSRLLNLGTFAGWFGDPSSM